MPLGGPRIHDQVTTLDKSLLCQCRHEWRGEPKRLRYWRCVQLPYTERLLGFLCEGGTCQRCTSHEGNEISSPHASPLSRSRARFSGFSLGSFKKEIPMPTANQGAGDDSGLPLSITQVSISLSP